MGGRIGIELGGTETNDYDRLHAVDGYRGVGDFYAGGDLNVTLINGFTPGADTFDILDYVTIDGTFDNVNLPLNPANWNTDDLYVTGEITYVPPPAGSRIMVR